MTTTSSTGGKITTTKTGLIHHCNTDRFISEADAITEHTDKKLSYDFSQFPTTVPVNTVGRIINFN